MAQACAPPGPGLRDRPFAFDRGDGLCQHEEDRVKQPEGKCWLQRHDYFQEVFQQEELISFFLIQEKEDQLNQGCFTWRLKLPGNWHQVQHAIGSPVKQAKHLLLRFR